MSLHVQLEKFEGPLGLLLYLIRKEEMDIFDINIHQITRQYLEYIRLMKELDLEMAGEFVAMAATLIQIKSRMLLPQYNEAGEVVEQEDPRKELVQKLLEYQKYKEAAQRLSERPWLHRDIWLRGTRQSLDFSLADEIVIDEGGLFSLISAYRKAVRSMKKNVHRVRAKAKSIAERVMEIRHLFRIGQRVLLRQLVDEDGVAGPRDAKLLITFLSLLELAKLGFVSLFQAQTYGDIYVDPKREVEDDIISRVEEFEVDHAAVAEKMFAGPGLGEMAEPPAVHEINAEAAQDAQLSLLEREDQMGEREPDDLALEGVDGATDEEILAEEARLELLASPDALGELNEHLAAEIVASEESARAEIEAVEQEAVVRATREPEAQV